jgi:hypothetical protein
MQSKNRTNHRYEEMDERGIIDRNVLTLLLCQWKYEHFAYDPAVQVTYSGLALATT